MTGYFVLQRFASEKEGDREVQRTMLELLNQLDGFSSHSDIKVSGHVCSEAIQIIRVVPPLILPSSLVY